MPSVSVASRVSLTVVTLVCCAGMAFAQDQKPEPVTKPEPAPAPVKGDPSQQVKPTQQAPVAPGVATEDSPRIAFDATQIDLGQISDDRPVTRQFRFTNTGKSTLTFTQQPMGSCGCTVPQLSKLSYEPGESGMIEVTYNPANRKGAQHTTVTVTTNDPVTPTQMLDVRTVVTPMLTLDPQVLNAGQVARGGEWTGLVTVESRLPDVVVTQATASSPRVVATVGSPTTVNDASGQPVVRTPIEIRLAADAAPGQLNETITIRTSNASRILSTTVLGEVLGNIAVTPSQLQMAGLTPGQTITTQLRLAPRNGQPFKVLSVQDLPTMGNAGMTFNISEDTSKTPSEWVVNVTGTAPQGQAAIRGELLVTTDSPSDSQMRVRYFGFTRVQQPQQAPRSVWDQNPSSLVPPSR